jgi:hypothetical protein
MQSATSRSIQDITPADWFIVAAGQAQDKEPWLFCSRVCLRHHPLSGITEEEVRKNRVI